MSKGGKVKKFGFCPSPHFGTKLSCSRRFCQAAGGGVSEECEGPLPPASYEACTLALYEGETMEEVLDIPDHLPPLCPEERLDNLEIRANKTSTEPIIQLIIQKVLLLALLVL